MGYRLSKIYTRTGDNGTTGLARGERVAKDAPRIEAIGNIDELNSLLGLLLCETLDDDSRTCLLRIQHELFNLGGELSLPDQQLLHAQSVDRLEQELDHMNDSLAPLREFILPGGTRAASLCHVARTVCRRAERSLVTLSRDEAVSETGGRYLNRLSDLLFVMARYLNHRQDVADVFWQRDGMD